MGNIIDNQEYLKNLVVRATYNSNAIEGNNINFEETANIIYNNDLFRVVNENPKDVHEVVNHKNAMDMIFERVRKNKKLDEKFIKKLDEVINKGIRDSKGYRKVMVDIKSDKYAPPPPEALHMQMFLFMDDYNNHEEADIFFKVAKFHMEFEKLHPFEDGVGRVGRLLIIYELLKNNISPAVILHEDKETYFDFLKEYDEIGLSDWLRILSNNEATIIEQFS